jgi:transcription factor-like protein
VPAPLQQHQHQQQHQPRPSSHVPSLATIAPKPPSNGPFQTFHAQSYGQPYADQLSSAGGQSAYTFSQAGQYDYTPPSASSAGPSPTQAFGSHGPAQSFLVSPTSDQGVFDNRPQHQHQQHQQQHIAQPAAPQHRPHAVVVDSVPVEAQLANPNRGQLAADDIEHEFEYLSENDTSMGESDDEYGGAGRESAYGTLVQSRRDGLLEGVGTHVRTFSTFAHHDILTSYIPNSTNSPLNDSRVAALFWHFVQVTGPSMSLYERHPFDHNDRPLAGSATAANQNIWTYTFPVIAFNHPALLQSMLAIGALQISKLQSLPETAALKHYHLAIRRIARNVKSHTRRTQPATIASILLLAYFEVWNSDHTKWSQHLYGARLLLKEVPFRNMTRHIIPLKRAKRALLEQERSRPMDPFFMGHDGGDTLPHDLDDIDVDFLTRLAGHDVQYENDGPLSASYYTDRDIEQYEHLRDLYWWYCKMDVYLGMLSGSKPL